MKNEIIRKILAAIDIAAAAHTSKYGTKAGEAYVMGAMEGWMGNMCNYMTENGLAELNDNLDRILSKQCT